MILVLVNIANHHRAGRSSSAAKKADAVRRISFVRLSSAFSLRRRLFSAAMSLVIPGSVPASMLACLRHLRKVSGPMLRRVPISRQVRVDACLGVVF